MRVVAAAILREGRLLAVQRSQSMAEPLKWEFPGGKVEQSESDAQALVREIQEELGIQINVVGPIAESLHGPILLCLYECTWLSGSIELAEHSQLQWHTASTLRTLGWAPADIPLIGPLAAYFGSRLLR